MKQEIISTPVLAYYNPKKKTILQTDASIKDLGAYLLQEEKQCILQVKHLQKHNRDT